MITQVWGLTKHGCLSLEDAPSCRWLRFWGRCQQTRQPTWEQHRIPRLSRHFLMIFVSDMWFGLRILESKMQAVEWAFISGLISHGSLDISQFKMLGDVLRCFTTHLTNQFGHFVSHFCSGQDWLEPPLRPWRRRWRMPWKRGTGATAAENFGALGFEMFWARWGNDQIYQFNSIHVPWRPWSLTARKMGENWQSLSHELGPGCVCRCL